MKDASTSKQLQLKLFESVVQFMATIGASETDCREAFEVAVAKIGEKKRIGQSADAKYQPNGDVSAHLLRMWFRDSRLVGGIDQKPRPLPMARGKNNLLGLVRKLDPSADAKAVISAMKSVGLIKRNGRGQYLPTASAAVIPKLHPWVMEHAVRSVIRFVSTIQRNSNPTPGLPPLLERYSYVPDLNPADAGSFAEFARRQGLAYLNTLDDWLEQRRVRPKRRSSRSTEGGIPAGVHLITFLGSDSDDSVRRERSRAPRQSTLIPPPSTPS